MNIAHCQACEKCNNGKGCIINDDMQAVYPALKIASLIIIDSPSFWGYMTSQLKTLFDRLEAVVHPDYFGNKDFILFVTYRRYYGSLLEWMKRITAGFESRLHHLCVQTFDPNTNKDIPITEMKEALEKAFDLGQSIRTKRSD